MPISKENSIKMRGVLLAALFFVIGITSGVDGKTAMPSIIFELNNAKHIQGLDRYMHNGVLYPEPIAARIDETADEGTTQESVSYDGVGVFRKNDNMTHPLRLPDPPEEIHTKFYLYEGKDKMTLVAHWDSALKIDDEGKLKNLKQITVLIHGFIQTSHVEWTLETGAALLEKERINAVVIDWGDGATPPNYVRAAGNTALVGRQIAAFLKHVKGIIEDPTVLSKVHLIGFSLGAQVAGFCGRYYRKLTQEVIDRITALDPAGYTYQGSNVHVSQDDATFVDAIHTSRGTNLLNGEFGMNQDVGHVDFYPNGGSDQPGCSTYLKGFMALIIRWNGWTIVDALKCSHGRATDTFAESVASETCRFKSWGCGGGLKSFISKTCSETGSNGEMGYYSRDSPGRGQQMLTTNKQSPFCVVKE